MTGTVDAIFRFPFLPSPSNTFPLFMDMLTRTEVHVKLTKSLNELYTNARMHHSYCTSIGRLARKALYTAGGLG